MRGRQGEAGAGGGELTIYVLCVDSERGRYLAVSTTDPSIIAVSYTNVGEAIGNLVISNPGIQIDEVVDLDERLRMSPSN